MFKKLRKNEKGFTLAELLIVVAIIGVLVAISIPIFTSQLEKSRDAVSIANIRAAYAEAQAAVLVGTADDNVAFTTYDPTTGNGTVTVSNVAFKGHKADDNFSGLAAELPFNTATGYNTEPKATNAGTVVFTYADQKITEVAYNGGK